jgi:hypothetical protein
MTKKLCALLLVLIAAPAMAADPDWQPVLGDLLKSDKPDSGRLGGVVVNHDTGCVFVNLGERGIYCSGAGATKFNPLSQQLAAGADKKFVVALQGAKGAQQRVTGKNEKHIFEVTKAGIIESTDGGANWSQPIALPKQLKDSIGSTWIDYDPQNNILYVMQTGSDLYKLPRGK